MKKYKFIETIPSSGYAFEAGDEIMVRKGTDFPYRWEAYKVAADKGIYNASITKEEWEKLNQIEQETIDVILQLDQDLVDKLTTSFTNEEIEQLINEGVLQSTSGLILIDGLELPTPVASTAFAMVGEGVYTKAEQPNVIVPSNHIGVLLWNGTIWKLGAVQEVPNNVDIKIEQQKGIPGGIAELDSKGLVPHDQVDSYSKAETDTWRTTNTNNLNNKVDKVTNKGLSTNDYVNEDKAKVNKLIISGDGKSVLTNSGEYVRFAGGNGSGFYNVTAKLPLAPGAYYNLQTAVSALAMQDILDEEKQGMIMTFEEANGAWVDYRFTGPILEFSNPLFWQEYTIKDIVRNVILNGLALEKDSAGSVYIDMDVEVDQTIDPNSTRAVAGAAVAAEFASLGAKYGTSLQLNEIGEDEDKVYSISLLDEEGNVLSTTAEFVAGGGGGGGPVATTKIVLSKNTVNPTVKEGDDVRLEFYYDHRDTTTDTSTGLQGTATITITSGATTKTIQQTLSADSVNILNVTPDLLVGANTIRVKVEVDNGDSIQVSSISWRVQVVTLRLTSSFDFATLVARGQNVTIPFTLSGSGVKTLRLYVDGVQTEDKVISTSSSNGSFIVNTSAMFHGSHSIQMVAELEVSSSVKLLSNSIYFDIAVRETSKNDPIVATRFDYNDGTIVLPGQRPSIKTTQFGEYKVNYAGYNPVAGQNLITVAVNQTPIASITSAFVQRSVTDRSTQSGNYPGTITIGTTVYTFNVNVAQSDVNLNEPTDNLVFKLTALGRSNSDTNKTTWTDRGITTTFQNIQWAGDGWNNNALRLMNGGKAIINYKPLDLNNAPARLNAFTFTTKFKVSSVSNTNSVLISCMSNGVGFQITSEEAKMVTSGNSEVLMKFASGREYNIAFVSMPVADPQTSSEYEVANDQMLYLYIDGILSGGVQRGVGDNIYQQGTPANITLQGVNSTLDVYNMRLYNNYLTSDQVLSIATIDLNTVAEILAKYEFNNVIDAEGDVTVESLPTGMRYVIVTGQQANGMNTLHYAAAINNKNTRYDVDQILHIIKGGDPKLNFVCVGGCIRLQGTSSLAYPIKNYRLYYRSAASSSVFGKVYVGCDPQGNGGELITAAKPKFSFKDVNAKGKRPAPVNVWCLKADFAESSSSHNTGMARMTNDVFVASGNPTPAQKYVSPTYQYDVRTAVDGEPCYLFYRNTLTDKPKFVGKYNFNNDKSTEEVFGFLDIPGYHLTNDKSAPSTWVTEKFAGKNPTECWEFLNNDYPMGSYLDSDFDKMEDGKPAWTKVFEARFPDVQDDYDSGVLGKPQYLSNWVTWVKSTQGNTTKFRNELANYADVKHLCAYFIFTQWMGAVDQMVKNAMLGFWYNPDVDKMLAYYIFYDGDTIFGLRNDGRLKYPWDVNRQTLDPELTASAGKNVYAFMGHDSVLWNNLEAAFPTELEQAYRSMRSVMTNDYIFNIFNRDQSGKFAERIYNLDAQYKYIEPKTLGINIINNGVITNTKYSYLEAMQGSRDSHRRWWIENRLDLFDARFSSGQYTLTDITWKGISDIGASVSATMARDYYVEFKREGTSMDRKFVLKDAIYNYVYDQTANVGTIFHLFGGKYFRVLNMSNWGGFTDLTLPVLVNLEHLILGRTGRTYTLSELVIGTKLPMLKIIDITNYTVLPSIDLSGCNRLEEVLARGCTNLGTINLASGAPINKLVLPTGLNTLRLVGLPYLTNAGITFPDGNNVKNLIVDSSPNINWELLYDTLGTVSNIRITNINKSGSITFLDKFKNLGGIDSNNNAVSTPRLVGTYRLDTYLEDSLYEQYRLIFPELNIKQPEFSVIRIYEKDPITGEDIPDTKNLQNPENGTGYGTSKAYEPSGHFLNIINNRHRYLGKQVEKGVMTICQLHDKNSNKFADNVNLTVASEALLDGQQGDVWVKEPAYWYKGVTDFTKGVTYACFSSNKEKPSSPATSITKKYTKQEFISTGNITTGSYIRRGYSTIQDAMTSNAATSILRMDVEGYKKVKVKLLPYATNTNGIPDICSSFTNVAGVTLEDVRVNLENFTPGTDYIANVPVGAKYFYVTVLKDYVDSADDFYFTATKSDNILDIEPEWVETKEKLVSPFETSWVNNKLRSIKTRQSFAMENQTFFTNLTKRNLTTMNFRTRNEIANLIYFKYGDRDIQRLCGVVSYHHKHGTSTNYGMLDSANNGLTTDAGYWVITALGERVFVKEDLINTLGYESFYVITSAPDGNLNQTMAEYDMGVDVRMHDYTLIRTRNLGDRSPRYVLSNNIAAFFTRMQWGLKLDILATGMTQGFENIHYPDVQRFAGRIRYYTRLAQSGFGTGIFGIATDAIGFDAHRTGRLTFEGLLIETKNVVEFKQLQEFA